MPCVLIIDDNLLIRQGLRSLLEQELPGVLFGEVMGSEDALAEIAGPKWDLIILDVGPPNSPDTDGFFLLNQIRRRDSLVPVLVMSERQDPRHARLAQEFGATGYAGKDSGREDLSAAIQNVFAGRKHFAGSQRPNLKNLSPRESRVMLALASGKRATEIATDLNLSIKTVSTYRRRALDKMLLDTTADLTGTTR
jgi:DNA-binding NarL/FixJ family response regulator